MSKKINNKCRTCLNASRGLQSLSKIATEENTQQKSYAEILYEIAKINIMNCKFPQLICGCCSRKLVAAHAFIQQAQEVNEKLCLMLLNNDGNKHLDCLQETQIDIESCLEIKMEHDEVDNNNTEELLEKNIQLKKEETETEEDFLTANTNKSDNKVEGNCLENYFDMTFSNLETKMGDKEDDVRNISEQNMDTSDNNSINDEHCASDDVEWQEESEVNNKKQKEKKSSLLTRTLLRKSSHRLQNKASAEKVNKQKKNDTVSEDELLPAKCNDCDKVFPNARLLNRHRRGTHVPDDLKIQCLQCDAKFSRRHNMYAHMRLIHKTENVEELKIQPKQLNKQYVCQECPRAYTNKYKLIAHVKSQHSSESKPSPEKVVQPKKRFLCTLCGLTFNSQSNLNIHFRRHTGEKPFKCEFCERAYHRLYDVQVHRRSHTGEKPYQCTVCEKAFRRSSKLKIHMRTHTNERPYKCTQCEKAFKQSKDLNIHKRTHTGERPYKCDVCQSTFTQSNSLRLHQIKQKHLETSNSVNDLSGEITFISQQT